jgi:hypothetical protein
MNADQWEYIQHFHAGENFGDWTYMDFQFIRTLDTVRHRADTPFELTSPAYTKRTGHSKKSFHYIGRAADFKLPKLSPFPAYDRLVETFADMGISAKIGFGFYPDGGDIGSNAPTFFHFDDRAMHPGVQYEPGVVWVRIDNPVYDLPLGYTYGSNALRLIEVIRDRGIGR